jgi:hypothetical protein
MTKTVSTPRKAAAKTPTTRSTRTTGTKAGREELVTRTGKGRKFPAEVLAPHEVGWAEGEDGGTLPMGGTPMTPLVELDRASIIMSLAASRA